MALHYSRSMESFSTPKSPCSTSTTFSNTSTASQSGEMVLVYELDTQRTRKCRRERLELQHEEFVQTDPANLKIKKLQRGIDIVIKGDEETHEASRRVAYARVPLTVMVQRVFGNYTELRVINRV